MCLLVVMTFDLTNFLLFILSLLLTLINGTWIGSVFVRYLVNRSRIVFILHTHIPLGGVDVPFEGYYL